MANVGEKTGKKTQAGRDVYKTPEGEMVSEKSTTFEYKGKWINIPTIHDGKQYSQDQLINMLDKGLIKPTSTHNKLEEAVKAAKSRSKSLKFNEGGLADQTLEAFGQPNKGLSWGELIVDNILGLDNEYESFGEKLGKAINEDEIKFLKDAAVGVYEGTKEFVQAPVETTKQVVNEIKDSVTRLGSEDLNTRLQRMYNVTYEQATDEQVNQAREAVLGDALTALELVPAAKVTTTVASAAIPSGLKADAIGQTKALLSGDREFLSGTPSNRASTQSLSAGFTGQNPPTYIPKDEPVFDPEDITTSGYDTRMFFREPIAEFTRKLTMANSFPSKGMTGAEFLRLLEKNAESIPPSSYKEGLVDKNKRYSREELLDAVTNRRRYPPKSLYYSTADLDAPRVFENIQRQSEVGFTGYPTNKNSYFSIPIITETVGKNFKANSQHFDPRTTAHVRGSFVDAMVGYDVNETLSPRFKSIIGREDKYLLVEEIQSDLLQKGYRKPKNSFDTAFDRATEEALRGTQTTFQESYGDITNDLKSLIKTLDSKNLEMPEEPLRLRPVFRPGALNRNGNPQFKDRIKRDFIDGIASRGTVDGVSYVDFDEIMDYINKQGVNSTHIHQVFRDLVDKANRPGYLYGDDRIAFTGPDGTVYNNIIISQTNDQGVKRFYVNPNSEDYERATEQFDFYSRDFGLNYDEILEIYEGEIDEYYNAIAKEIEGRGLDKDIERPLVSNIYENFRENKKLEETLGDQTNTALPPVRKNKQTVEEALKLLIAKADQQGVDKIVIPPAERIALARGRTIEPDDKGDRFYRTYVTDLDKALKDLEKNYPVTVHRDVELPYRNIADVYDPEDDIDLDDIDEIFNENDTDLFFTVDEEGELTPEDQALQNLLAGGADTEVTPEVANQIDQMIANMLQDPTEEIVEETLKESAKEPSKLGTIIDISKLREQFQVDKPRQFAEGGSIRPKLRPEGFANTTSPKPRLRPDPERQYGLADVEFRADVDPLLSKDPIARLGFDVSRIRYSLPEGLNNAFYASDYSTEDGLHTEHGVTFEPDTINYGPDFGSSKETIVHETRHRGLALLREMLKEDPEYFSERYGTEATVLLDKDLINEELLTELFDNPDATYVAPTTGEEKNLEPTIQYVEPDTLRRIRERGSLGPNIPNADIINKGIVGLRFAAEDMLKEAGEPTGYVDMSTGPKSRPSKKYKPNVWQRLIKKYFAEGGAVGNMNQQMSFAFEDGGLRDDGMMRDPVSGNEVPPGSTAKEVRDDIPAQLSEGEYVVPADVVRYYGVKFFEDLRDNAKMGLQDMEARGRIGGEPVPAGGPMDGDDLSPEELAAIQEMMGMAEGGVVNMYKQQQDLYSPPNPAIGNPTTTGMAAGGEVRGYQPGGLTQQQQAEQGFYAAGQQAQNAGFIGFPLGSTIFPSAGTGTTFTSPTAATGTTAFTPVNMINMQTGVRVTATTQADYDRYISEGYVVDDGTLQPKGQGSGGGGGGGPTPPPTEPYKDWLASADFNSAEGLEKFVAGITYDPTKDQTTEQAFGATLIGGPMAGLATAVGGSARGGLSAISDLRAASLIAKAQGLDKLAAKYDKQVADIIEKGPGILDFLDDVFATGKQKANAWAKKNGHENIQAAIEAGVTPKPAVLPEATPAQKTATKAVSDYESLKKPSGGNDDDLFPSVVTKKSVAETKAIMDKQTPETIKDTTKNLERTTAKVKDIQSGKNTSGQVGFKEGGLMAKGKKKKK